MYGFVFSLQGILFEKLIPCLLHVVMPGMFSVPLALFLSWGGETGCLLFVSLLCTYVFLVHETICALFLGVLLRVVSNNL